MPDTNSVIDDLHRIRNELHLAHAGQPVSPGIVARAEHLRRRRTKVRAATAIAVVAVLLILGSAALARRPETVTTDPATPASVSTTPTTESPGSTTDQPRGLNLRFAPSVDDPPPEVRPGWLPDGFTQRADQVYPRLAGQQSRSVLYVGQPDPSVGGLIPSVGIVVTRGATAKLWAAAEAGDDTELVSEAESLYGQARPGTISALRIDDTHVVRISHTLAAPSPQLPDRVDETLIVAVGPDVTITANGTNVTTAALTEVLRNLAAK